VIEFFCGKLSKHSLWQMRAEMVHRPRRMDVFDFWRWRQCVHDVRKKLEK